jgi:hypothetical protein
MCLRHDIVRIHLIIIGKSRQESEAISTHVRETEVGMDVGWFGEGSSDGSESEISIGAEGKGETDGRMMR